MWTKSEDLHGKYVKINSEEDYETVSKVLEELGFKYDKIFDKEKYQNRFKSVFIQQTKNYFLSETSLGNIPIQQFYDYLSSKTLKTIPEYVECTTSKSCWQGIFIEGKIYKKHDYASISSINLIAEDGLTHHVSYLGINLSFKPSTKEAYEAQNKPKYKVGRWYKIHDNWYAKFKTIHGQGTFWQYSESITSKGNYDGISHNLKMSDINSGLKIKLLTDLSEIQEYLPYDHVDKIKPENKSLVGRYVKVIDKDSEYLGDYYLLERKISDKSYYGKHLKSNTSNCFLPNYFWELMPEGFIPDNVSKEKWIPKVGDWVYILESANTSTSALNNKGKVVKVISTEYKHYIQSNLKNCGGIYLNEIRKAEPHEIPKEESNTSTTQKVIKEMSKEELLEETKRRYPVGCEIVSVNGRKDIIDNHNFRFGISSGTSNNIYYNNGNIELYHNDSKRWAEIVELPKNNTFDLSNTKIKVDTPELSRLVQEKAFELGWKWGTGKDITALDSKYLFFYNNKFITVSDSDVTFQQKDYKEIFPSDLGINVVNNKTKSQLYPINPEQLFKNYEVVGSFTVSNTVIPKEVIKKKGFDEKEFYSNPFNQVLELPKKSKQNNKKQLILT